MQDLSPIDLDVAASLMVRQIAEDCRLALEPEREPGTVGIVLGFAASVFAWIGLIEVGVWVWGVMR